MCLARGKKGQVGCQEGDQILSTLGTGGGEGSEGLPGGSATGGLVAAGEFAGDDGGAELTLGQIVGRVRGGLIEEAQQVIALFGDADPEAFLGGVSTWTFEECVDFPF